MGICMELSLNCLNCPKWTLYGSVSASSLPHVTPTFGSSDPKVRHRALQDAVKWKGGSSAFVYKAPESQLYRKMLIRGIVIKVCSHVPIKLMTIFSLELHLLLLSKLTTGEVYLQAPSGLQMHSRN